LGNILAEDLSLENRLFPPVFFDVLQDCIS